MRSSMVCHRGALLKFKLMNNNHTAPRDSQIPIYVGFRSRRGHLGRRIRSRGQHGRVRFILGPRRGRGRVTLQLLPPTPGALVLKHEVVHRSCARW